MLVINAVLFIVEGSAGLLAHSTALLADALDMLGDALVYGFSLFVLARSLVAALFVVIALRVLRQARVEFRRAGAVTLSPPVAPIPARKHVLTADMPPRPVSPGAGE